jgi:hypothetical protein
MIEVLSALSHEVTGCVNVHNELLAFGQINGHTTLAAPHWGGGGKREPVIFISSGADN